MDYRLVNRVAVITGGTSGIGLAVIKLLLAEGANAALCARDAARLKSVVDDCAARYGADRVFGMVADVRDKAAMARFAQAVEAKFGGVDILINNAGQGRMSNFANTADEVWTDELDLKFFSIIHPTRAFLPLLERGRDAAIVCTNALLAVRPEAYMIATSAARAGVLNLVKSLANDFAAKNIRVNSVLIGLVESNQWERRYQAAVAADPQITRDGWFGELARSRHIPLGRLGKPEEAAQAIVFLASPASSYVTGTTLDVSGGQASHV